MPNLRKPNEVHLMNGTYRADRHGKLGGELKITEPIPNPPDWLDRDAVVEWMKVVGILSKYNMLKATDEACLALYCSLYSQLMRLRDTFPANKMVQLRAVMNDLGLTPASRSKIKVPDKNENKPTAFSGL